MIKITFNDRPHPFDISSNIVFKMSIILMIMYYCTGKRNKGKVSLQKMIIYFWAIKNNENFRKTLQFKKSKNIDEINEPFRLDTSLNQTLTIALSSNYIEIDRLTKSRKDISYRLTENGEQFILFLEEQQVFIDYSVMVKQIGNISENSIKNLFNKWS